MDYKKFTHPIIGLCAYSGSGKTTLLEKILPILVEKNIRVAVIKHAHHTFDIDHPEKDSFKIRKAGAQQMLISSKKRWALMNENTSAEELTLDQAIQHLTLESIDVIIVEGYKTSKIPKIEIHRPSLGKNLISTNDPHVLAIATDQPDEVESALPKLDLNRANTIASFIVQFINSHGE